MGVCRKSPRRRWAPGALLSLTLGATPALGAPNREAARPGAASPPAADTAPPAADEASPLAAAPSATAQASTGEREKDRVSHNLRLQARTMLFAPPLGESSAQASYFSLMRPLALFANGELVFLESELSHFEGELNAGVSPLYFSRWFDWFSVNGRLQWDYSDYRTVGAGLQVTLDRVPGTIKVWKALALSSFVQYFGLKSDNHWGDHDLYLWYEWKPVGNAVYLRGFSRALVWNDGRTDFIHAADLIVTVHGGFDLHLRVTEQIEPRRSGLLFGVRYLFKLKTGNPF